MYLTFIIQLSLQFENNFSHFIVIICPFAGMDMWGALHSVSRADFIRNTIKNIEFYMKIGFEQSQIHGPGARQFVILFDMKDFNLKQYTWRPGTCNHIFFIRPWIFQVPYAIEY